MTPPLSKHIRVQRLLQVATSETSQPLARWELDTTDMSLTQLSHCLFLVCCFLSSNISMIKSLNHVVWHGSQDTQPALKQFYWPKLWGSFSFHQFCWHSQLFVKNMLICGRSSSCSCAPQNISICSPTLNKKHL